MSRPKPRHRDRSRRREINAEHNPIKRKGLVTLVCTGCGKTCLAKGDTAGRECNRCQSPMAEAS